MPASIQDPAARAAASSSDGLGLDLSLGLEASLTSNADEAPGGTGNATLTPWVDVSLSRPLGARVTGSAGLYGGLSRYHEDGSEYNGESLYPYAALYVDYAPWTLETGYSHDYGFTPGFTTGGLYERRLYLALRREATVTPTLTVRPHLELARSWDDDAAWTISPALTAIWQAADSLFVTLDSAVELGRFDERPSSLTRAVWGNARVDYAFTDRVTVGVSVHAYREYEYAEEKPYTLWSAAPFLTWSRQF